MHHETAPEKRSAPSEPPLRLADFHRGLERAWVFVVRILDRRARRGRLQRASSGLLLVAPKQELDDTRPHDSSESACVRASASYGQRSSLTEQRVEHENPCPSFCGRWEVGRLPHKVGRLRRDQQARPKITSDEYRGNAWDGSTHHSLDDICEVIASSDEERALLSVGRADFVDPGEDQRTGAFLRVESATCAGGNGIRRVEVTHADNAEPVQGEMSLDIGV
jgi:hypothetical protein